MFSKLLKPLLWLLALCLAVYICICSYMFAQQRSMIYQGDSTQVSADKTNFSLQRDVLQALAGLGLLDRGLKVGGRHLFARTRHDDFLDASSKLVTGIDRLNGHDPLH